MTAGSEADGSSSADLEMPSRSATAEMAASACKSRARKRDQRTLNRKNPNCIAREGNGTRPKLTLRYSVPQLNACPAFCFLSSSRSCFKLFGSFEPFALFGARPIAGKMCNNRPWKVVPSRALKAVTASAGWTNVTYARPLAWFVLVSIGMWTWSTGPNVEHNSPSSSEVVVNGKFRRNNRPVSSRVSCVRAHAESFSSAAASISSGSASVYFVGGGGGGGGAERTRDDKI
mgnify:CR=1 FL=1